MTVTRPEIVTEEHLKYLDNLRESGRTNMYGAGSFVIGRFAVTKREAEEIVVYWMESFDERTEAEVGS